MDSEQVETYSVDDETIVDESVVEPELDTTIPTKKWMGQFDSPEDLEKHAFRLAQEKNEYERKLKELSDRAEPATDSNEIQSFYNQTFQEEYNNLLEDAIEEYGSKENIPARRLQSINRNANKAAKIQADTVFLAKELKKISITTKVQSDEEYQAVKQLIDNDPDLRKRKDDPEVWELGKKFLQSASRMNQSAPRQVPVQPQPRYVSSQGSREKAKPEVDSFTKKVAERLGMPNYKGQKYDFNGRKLS